MLNNCIIRALIENKLANPARQDDVRVEACGRSAADLQVKVEGIKKEYRKLPLFKRLWRRKRYQQDISNEVEKSLLLSMRISELVPLDVKPEIVAVPPDDDPEAAIVLLDAEPEAVVARADAALAKEIFERDNDDPENRPIRPRSKSFGNMADIVNAATTQGLLARPRALSLVTITAQKDRESQRIQPNLVR